MSKDVEIIHWFLDTRNLWPSATKTVHLQDAAADALALLTEEERTAVFRFVFVRDAKMSLASHLLKHYVLSKYLGLPWHLTAITRDPYGKPIFVDPVTGTQPLCFNISHQAGIVALIAVVGYRGDEGGENGGSVQVGVDVVCTSERRDRDRRTIRDQGWDHFVEIHADVFGLSEVRHLRNDVPEPIADASAGELPPSLGQKPDSDIVDSKLRSFYALWCLREAYVKMTGEALLAEWLKELEFRGFRAPRPVAWGGCDASEESGVLTEHEVLLKGERQHDVNICLRSLGPDYMIATAVRTPTRPRDAMGWANQGFESLDVQTIVEHGANSKSITL